MSTNTSSYTICSAPNIYIFVYILTETRIAPLIYLHLCTDIFIKISPQSLDQIQIDAAKSQIKLTVFMLYLQFVLTQILMNCWYMSLLHMGKLYIPFLLY